MHLHPSSRINTTVPTDPHGFRQWQEDPAGAAAVADVLISTAGGRTLRANSGTLAEASPVLDKMFDRSRSISIHGVPSDAVLAFLRRIYCNKQKRPSSLKNVHHHHMQEEEEEEEEMKAYGVPLLALSNAYRVGWMKRECEEVLAARLTPETVVDMLKLSRLCDAPRLYVRCMRVLSREIATVEGTESWRFISAHDPHLLHHIIRSLTDADLRGKKRRRKKEEQEVYLQLSEAMDCLSHICTDGCSGAECPNAEICRRLRLGIVHYAACSKKKLSPQGCPHCKRICQLFRLHSYICDGERQPCKVPLCGKFREKMKEEEGDDQMWRMLMKKVVVARAMSSFAKRKWHEEHVDRRIRTLS